MPVRPSSPTSISRFGQRRFVGTNALERLHVHQKRIQLVRGELAAGFLHTEGIIDARTDIAHMVYCVDGESDLQEYNALAVHLRGRLEPLPSESLLDMLDRQSAHFEDQLHPKRPWTTDKMTPEVLDRMMRQILPFRFRIEDVQGTWKLNQNKDDAVRLRASDHIETGHGVDLAKLARLMRDVPEKD